MAKVTPKIGGQLAPIHGSFVIGPDSTSALDIDGSELVLEFVESSDTRIKIERNEPKRYVCTIFTTPFQSQAAFELSGFHVSGKAVVLNLAVTMIGTSKPHRLVTYTFSASPYDLSD